MCGFLAFKGRSLSTKTLSEASFSIQHRGPDSYQELHVDEVSLFFHRLAIVDLSTNGSQPFVNDRLALVCNGEIFESEKLRLECKDYPFQSSSDCEVLLPLYERYGIEKLCKILAAEFAFALYDKRSKKLLAARDPIGIRPLFYGKTEAEGEIVFASEAKALLGICIEIQPFPPAHYFDGKDFIRYCDPTQKVAEKVSTNEEQALQGIRDALELAVKRRLVADAPVAFLLSGGLDSSLVCALASRMSSQPIRTFAIGTEYNPIDLAYAEEAAEFLGAQHCSVQITRKQILEALPKVIKHFETWDITTIRAGIGMFLVCEYISKHSDIKVLLTGEVSDELFGYKYTDFAPSAEAFQNEAEKRVRELYMYDLLRADRAISAHALEARVPFGDIDFVEHVMSIPAEMKMNHEGTGKLLLRKAFSGRNYLPDSILWREKAAFSDAVGHSLVDDLKDYAASQIDEQSLKKAFEKYPHGTPMSAEALLYREIFEEFYPERSHWISGFWMPNKAWKNCDVSDPSARVLPNYGKSGAMLMVETKSGTFGITADLP